MRLHHLLVGGLLLTACAAPTRGARVEPRAPAPAAEDLRVDVQLVHADLREALERSGWTVIDADLQSVLGVAVEPASRGSLGRGDSLSLRGYLVWLRRLGAPVVVVDDDVPDIRLSRAELARRGLPH